jgi:hypothetical protein
MQKVRRHPFPFGHRAPTACKCMVSGTFHSASSSAFHRSIALLVHYRSSRSIQPWAVVRPVSREVPRASRYSGEPMLTGTCSCRIPDYHCLWCDFPDTSARNGFVTPHGFRNPGTNPGLGYFRFRSPLLTESMSLSFPPGT